MSYEIKPAKYSKGNLAVRCLSDGNWFKTRAMRLIANHLNGRWSRREKAYIVSPSKAAKFEKLFADGLDADAMTGKLFNPDMKYDDSTPMFDKSGMMLDKNGNRSIFDDVDD